MLILYLFIACLNILINLKLNQRLLSFSTTDLMNFGLALVNWKKIPADSYVHFKGSKIRKVLLTVDATIEILILAKNLGCDCVVAHHPIGSSYINFSQVFNRHIEYLQEYGISLSRGNQLVNALKERIDFRTHSSIYDDVVSAAKLLDMPLLNIHQPLDEYMKRVITENIKNNRPNTIQELINGLYQISEFHNAHTRIKIACGSKKNSVGRYVVVIAAGTNGGYAIANEYFENDVSTVIYLHIDYGELSKLREKKNKLNNLLILGHLAGDSIGINAYSNILIDHGIDVIKLGIIE